MRLRNLRQTSIACPSQWEAETDDGGWFYARYRWGWFAAATGQTLEEAVDRLDTRAMVECSYGESEWDGEMDTATMLRLVGAEVAA